MPRVWRSLVSERLGIGNGMPMAHYGLWTSSSLLWGSVEAPQNGKI